MLLKTLHFIVLLVYCLKSINCARILVVLPTPSHAHNAMYRTIYKELSERQHEVVVFTPDPIKDAELTNLVEIDVSYLYENIPDLHYDKLYTIFQLGVLEEIQKISLNLSTEILRHPEMQRLVNNTEERFDLVMVEWDVNPSLGVLSRRFGCPLIGLRAKQLQIEGHESVGNPTNPSYIAIGWGDFEMTFWGRLDNFLMGIIWRIYYHWSVVPKAQKVVDELFPKFAADVVEMRNNVSLIVANTHPVFTGIRPVVPTFIEVGGVHLGREPKPIPDDILKYLNQANEGVIYVNLGSTIKSSNICPEFLKAFTAALSSLPYKILWRWDSSNVKQLPLNVRTKAWLPQEAVLGHPNVKAFVTHGGLQSLYEAIDNEVPSVCVPFFADQHVNARTVEKLSIGKKVDFRHFKKSVFVRTVKKVAVKQTYRKRIKYMRELLHDLPMKPLEKAVWWIEYVLRHNGTRFMRSPAIDMGWIEYLLLDIAAFVLFCTIAALSLVWYLLKWLRSIVIKRFFSKEKTE